MATIPQIAAALQNVLGAYQANPLLASAANDLYEAYLFSIVVEAAALEGATISYYSSNGALATQLCFRRSPGHIQSTGPFTHALVTFPNADPLEIHVGVRVLGVSQWAHECDVAVISKSECDRARRGAILPRSRGLILAIEAKYYASMLPLGLARGFLGLGKEFKSVPVALATNIVSNSVVSVILHHNAQADDGVMPGSQAHSRLLQFISNLLHKHKH